MEKNPGINSTGKENNQEEKTFATKITDSLEKTSEVFFRETLERLKNEFNLGKYNLSENTIKI